MNRSGWPRSASRFWVIILGVLGLTGAYLAILARSRMDLVTSGVVLLHVCLGLLAIPALFVEFIRCCGRGWRGRSFHRRAIASRRSRPPFIGPASMVGDWLLAIGGFTGVAMLISAAHGVATSSAVLVAHEMSGASTLVLIGAILLARYLARNPAPQELQARLSSLRWLAPPGVLILALLLLGALGSTAALRSAAPPGQEYDSAEYYMNMTATNARQAGNPLFPAGTRLTAAAGARVRSSAYCGALGCHPQAFHQWLGSAHHSAAVDSIYCRSATLFGRERGPTARRWCEGCHGPLAPIISLRPGLLSRSDAGQRAPDVSPSQEGVNCLTCHAAARAYELTGNGRLELDLPSEYPFAEATDPRLRWIHGFLIRLRPEPHRHAFMKPDVQTQSEFCSSCHRMSYNLPQNGYKYLSTEDEYGSWQTGPDSGQSIHGFYPPGLARRCQDCHDPHGMGVGVRQWQPIPNSTTHSVGTRPNPNPHPVTVDLLALRRAPRMPGAPEELVAPLDRAAPLLRPGEAVTVDVVVRNRGFGHEFPAGVGNRKEVWLEFGAIDRSGTVLLESGGEGRGNAFDTGAHTYGMIGLDRAGRRLEQGDFWNMVTPLYRRSILSNQPDLDRQTIQPGESDVVRYRLRVPASATRRIKLRTRLWCRWPADSGVGFVSSVIAEDAVTLPIAGINQNQTVPPVSGLVPRQSVPPYAPGVTSPALPGRFYDYGVGLLLQGDLPRAQAAMRRVQAWAPRDVRGYLGSGRVYLTEGDMLAAEAQFEKARRLAPEDPRPRAFLATTHRRIGQYDRALAELEPLVRDYPRDRALWFDRGMCYYLTGRFTEAARAFQAMLSIDPNDLAAHYNLMRCLRPLDRVAEARHEEVVYQSLREDDTAKQIGLSYLRRHRLSDREARTVHEHDLSPVSGRRR